ncbi:30-kDa cleavage and polyadenylation specificity factor 30 [Spatholobus suberectus]|nr:30-kDa cleavage and polyadenylation specificity factor 30 [Spatholobus suberectus]
MSSDSAKENASVVDSSVTEWRHDIGNSDDPESSGYKFNENINPTRAVGHSHGQIGHPTGIGVEKWHNMKYFIIKSLNHQNIRLSIEKGIWATQIMNEPILEEAFHNSGSVILIFSVNMSGSFQGYAQMMSSIGRGRDNVWSEGTGKSNPWGRSFKVKWLCLNDLPFHKTLHLKNSLNDYKPVKISRDCQELSPDIGLALCELLDGKNDTDGLLTSSSRDDFSSKGYYVNTPSSMGDEDCNFPPLHLSWSMPLPYSSLFYQNQPEVNKFHSTNQRFGGTMFTEILPTPSESSQVSGNKCSHFSGHNPKLQMNKDVASQFDFWGLSSGSPLASTLTEDDFLDMIWLESIDCINLSFGLDHWTAEKHVKSYEEYLEVHSRCRKQLLINTTKPSWKQLESLRSNLQDDRNLEDEVHRDRSNSWEDTSVIFAMDITAPPICKHGNFSSAKFCTCCGVVILKEALFLFSKSKYEMEVNCNFSKIRT